MLVILRCFNMFDCLWTSDLNIHICPLSFTLFHQTNNQLFWWVRWVSWHLHRKITFILICFMSLCRQDPATSRTLTLISKTIQTLGSLAKSKSVSFSAHSGFFEFSFLWLKPGFICISIQTVKLILLSLSLSFHTFQANFKESYMAAFYDYFNEQKYADAVKNVSVWLHSLLHSINLGQFVDTPSDIFLSCVSNAYRWTQIKG